MQIGIVGLGRMGGNIARRLMKAGHTCVVYDANPKAGQALEKEGAAPVGSLEEMVKALKAPRAIWSMLPAGKITEDTIEALSGLMEKGDTVIDGGNTYYKDDIRRAKTLSEKGLYYIDCGTSGGVWGLERGYCMMIGGPKAEVERLDPAISSAPRAARGRIPGPSRAISTPVPPAPATSSRWSTTASSTA
jgi:6-phosphogluconate dehydrogenase